MYSRNIPLLYALYFLSAFSLFWNVVYVLFMEARGLSFFQISILFSVGSLMFLLFEIFTGTFSDRYGRRAACLVATFLLALSSFLFATFDSFSVYLVAAALSSLGGSFWSGTSDSLLYETLKKLKRQKEYTKVLSRCHFLFIVSGALTNFLAPVVLELDLSLPFYVGCFFAVLAFVLCLFFKETSTGSYEKHFSNVRKTLSGVHLRWVVLFAIVACLGPGYFADLLNQPFIKEGRSLFSYGVIFSVATLVQAFLVWKTDALVSFARRFGIGAFITFLFPLTLVLLSVSDGFLLIVLMGFAWFLGSFRYLVVSNEINRLVKKDSERATIHSVSSMFIAFLYLIFNPLYGLYMDSFSLVSTLYLTAALAFVLPGLVLLFKPKNLSF